ncbi:hypothetical protein BKA65DRAFT_46031 [Rhexocercosporidium sp. MPI-PUGE-AT-0058]|nr:hypothetical protein BKA65DRAFT_46031 [Rhexocercosporidium sp. MPI-PUGE-AT-0058]
MDPFTQAAAILKLVTTAVETGLKVYTVANEIRSAPQHIRALVIDLGGFHSTLVQIHGLFTDDNGEAVLEFVQDKHSKSLRDVVENCLFTFSEIDSLVDEYKSRTKRMDFSTWQRIMWTFKEAQIIKLREALLSHKANLTIAVAIFNAYVSHYTRASAARTEITMADLQTQIEEINTVLPQILSQLEDFRLQKEPKGPGLSFSTLKDIRSDLRFNLNRYANSTASAASAPETAGFRVSTLGTSGGHNSTSVHTSDWVTAKLHQSEPEVDRSSRDAQTYTQLFIRGVPSPAGSIGSTMVIQVEQSDTIESVKEEIRRKLGLPCASFTLFNSGRVLNQDGGATVNSSKLQNNSTLICNSFRPNHLADRYLNIIAIRDGDTVTTIEVNAGDNLRDIKAKYNDQEGLEYDTLLELEYFYEVSEYGKMQSKSKALFDSTEMTEANFPSSLRPVILDVSLSSHFKSEGSGYFPVDFVSTRKHVPIVYRQIISSRPKQPSGPLGIPWIRIRRRFYGFMRV